MIKAGDSREFCPTKKISFLTDLRSSIVSRKRWPKRIRITHKSISAYWDILFGGANGPLFMGSKPCQTDASSVQCYCVNNRRTNSCDTVNCLLACLCRAKHSSMRRHKHWITWKPKMALWLIASSQFDQTALHGITNQRWTETIDRNPRYGGSKSPDRPGLSSWISDLCGIKYICWIQHNFFSMLMFANLQQSGQWVKTGRFLEQLYCHDVKIHWWTNWSSALSSSFSDRKNRGARLFTPTCGALSGTSLRLFLPWSETCVAFGKAIHPAKAGTEPEDHSQS
jgi:hypothetical protein